MTTEASHEIIPIPPVRATATGLLTTTSMPSIEASADARAEVGSWSPSTRRSYVTGWRDFTSGSFENRCVGLPAAPADVGRYLYHLVEREGRTMATAHTRLAAIAEALRLGGHPDPTSRSLVEATLKRLGRENVISVGNSGTGKTHMALGLGLAACQRGMSVGFTTPAALVHEMMEARDDACSTCSGICPASVC